MTSSRKKQIANTFGLMAGEYDEEASVQKQIAERLAFFLPALPDEAKVLEIGCGTGFLTRHLFHLYPKASYYITDLSPAMMAACRHKFRGRENTAFGVMDGEYPDTEDTYDLIVAGMTVQWFDNVAEGIQRLRGYLRPQGQLFFSVPGPENFREWQQTLDKESLRSGLLKTPVLEGVFRESRFPKNYGSAEDFIKALRRTGSQRPDNAYDPLSPGEMRRALRRFNNDYSGNITWHVQFGTLGPPADQAPIADLDMLC